ncbi:hypothetical protein [Agaribacterium sp. ZY112]|uniref:hypothetical protein n=1 Tax=Agaribacterium sp. ZY112 TaxID=3233574 RepID=UPI0035268E8E
MNYCKYHPSVAATHYCSRCELHSCDACVDDKKGLGEGATCFTCSRKVQSLGASHTALPFWRRLKESLHYPASTDAIILIIGCAVLTSLLAYAPLGFIWILMLFGVFMKYCFSCLKSTAEGGSKAPSITEAYSGGLVLLLQLFFLSIVLGAVVSLAYAYLGPGAGMFIAVLIVAASPAMIINFAMHDTIIAALDPVKAIQLIKAIGLSYGLLLGFIMLMFASMEFVGTLAGEYVPVLGSILQASIANYYTIVIFHIMGYMIFQYQEQLGFAARMDGDVVIRSDYDRVRAKMDVMLKEGDQKFVLDEFIRLIQQQPTDRSLHSEFFNYVCATKDIGSLVKLSNVYFSLLHSQKQDALLYSEYRRCVLLSPKYLPDTAVVRHAIAEKTLESGDFPATIRLINGLHKQYPKYRFLAEAYKLMLQALEFSGAKSQHIQACKKLVVMFSPESQEEEKKPKKRRLPPKNKVRAESLEESIRARAGDELALDSMDEVASSMENSAKEKDQISGDLPPIDFKL